MTADLLRRAAALMRERAQAATPSPWRAEGHELFSGPWWHWIGETCVEDIDESPRLPWNADHIASWHPDVALAAATLIEVLADVDCMCGLSDDDSHCEHSAADAFARAYLGESA